MPKCITVSITHNSAYRYKGQGVHRLWGHQRVFSVWLEEQDLIHRNQPAGYASLDPRQSRGVGLESVDSGPQSFIRIALQHIVHRVGIEGL